MYRDKAAASWRREVLIREKWESNLLGGVAPRLLVKEANFLI